MLERGACSSSAGGRAARTDGGTVPISLDELFQILASERRRYVLYELRKESYVELDELARRVAALEADAEPAALSEEHIARVEIGLHHHDLPRLNDARLVEYDSRQCDVCASPYFDIVEKYLEIAEGDEVPRI